MDGVLFRGETALPGAAEFLEWLDAAGIAFRLLTNNATLTPEANAERMREMGVTVSAPAIFTSGLATAAYLKEQGAAGQNALVIGERGLLQALDGVGIRIVDDYRAARWVVAGLDRGVTYARLRDAARALQNGAAFIATNADSTLPVEGGLDPGAGAIQAVLTATTGMQPVVIGKPEPLMLDVARHQLGCRREHTAMLGDRLDTDILAAQRAQTSSILILTGVSTSEDLAAWNPPPEVVVESLGELIQAWESVR